MICPERLGLQTSRRGLTHVLPEATPLEDEHSSEPSSRSEPGDSIGKLCCGRLAPGRWSRTFGGYRYAYAAIDSILKLKHPLSRMGDKAVKEHDSSDASLKEFRMKRIFLLVAILVATSSLAFGQTSRNHTGRAGNDDEARRQVLATDDRRMGALRQGDPAPLRQIYADDYTLVTPSGVIRLKDEQINDLVSGRVRYRKIETTKRTVRVYGDVAIVLSREKYDILQAGQQVGGDIFFTRTYKKFGSEWREIAAHGTFVKQ